MYPKLRFKGFDDAWEQRELKEIAEYVSSNLTAKDAECDGFDLYDANNIIGKTTKNVQKQKYITKKVKS